MRKRLIPVLLIDRKRRLVKTVRFDKRTYIGDPFNVVRLFNEKEVDEICVLDIDATPDNREPDFEFLKNLAGECFMPLAYGGGITSIDHCAKLNHIGIDKFILGHSALSQKLVADISRDFGSQAVVACIDYAQKDGQLRCVTHSGQKATGHTPIQFSKALQDAGVGEIILQSVDRDGVRQGCDLEQISRISTQLSIPLISLGGASDIEHLTAAIEAGASAAASGSAFTFIGKLRAVLVTYPKL